MKIYAPQISGSLAINGTSIGNFNNLVSTSSFNQYTSSTSTGSLATTGSNTFVGNQTMSGSIIPAVTNIYDLGDVTHQFRHLYLSSGSLYINGTKVLGASGQELQITTDNGQSLKILEAGSDTITLQSADGNITLATSGGGDVILDPTSGIIALKGTTTLYAGNKILSSDGGAIQVGNDLGITGSLVTTGNINGINLTTFSSSVATQISTIQTKTGSFATTGSNSFIGNQNISGTVYLTGSLIPSGNFVYDLGSETNSFRDLFISTGSIRFHNPDGTEQGRITVDAKSGDISLLKTAGLTNEQKATISQGNINPDFLSAISASNLFVQTKIVMPAGGTVNGINLTAFSSSVASTLSNQNTATSSYETKGRGIISGSSQLTSSYDTRYVVSGSITQTTWDNIASKPSGIVSSSVQVLGGTGIISGSSQLNNASIENLTVINLTTVNETASVIFSSGSNRFGDFGNDIHDFTGSVKISGSITTIGASTATSYNGTINATNGVVSGSSQITYTSISSIPGGIVSGSTQTIANLPTGTVSGSSQVVSILSSLNTYTGSNDTLNSLQTTRIDQLAAGTASVNSFTASNGNTSLNSYTASNDTTNTAQNSRLTTIESVTGSYETKGRSIVSGSSQITYANISSIPGGIVSGSSQITYGNISSIPSGIVSGSSQVTGIGNAQLTNSTISGIALGSNLATLTIGTGLSGTSYNGSGAATIANTGVTSNVAGTGITVSGATGAVTITNSGVTSIVAGTGISINQGTGAVTVTNSITNNNQLTNGAGYITSAGTSADSNLLNSISAVNLYNNMGASHGTRVSFDASSPSYGFGYRFVQGVTNGPGTGGGTPGQFYSWYIGLGVDYPATGAGSYGAMFAVDRNSTSPYLSVRYNENNAFGSWRKISAGYADTLAGGSTITGTLNMATSGTNYIRMGVFPNSTSNSGEAWIGRASDRSAGTMTVQLGGGSASSRSFEIVDYSWNTVLFNVGSNGNATLSGTFTENSSLRYKENIEPIKYGLDKVLQMRGVTYNKKNNGVKEIGVIAEEIYEVLPEVVLKNEEGEIDSVSYGRITAVLIEAIKDLKKEIEELKANR